MSTSQDELRSVPMSRSLLVYSPFTPRPTFLLADERPNSPVPSAAKAGTTDTANTAATRNTLCTIRLRTLTSCRPGLNKARDETVRPNDTTKTSSSTNDIDNLGEQLTRIGTDSFGDCARIRAFTRSDL